MTKELIKEYADYIYPTDKRMNEYICKSTSEVIKTSQGFYLDFDKPSIEKSFCFSEGYNGMATVEGTKEALEMAEKAKKDVKYFIDENLKGINQAIEEVKTAEKLYIYANRAGFDKARSYINGEYFLRFPNHKDYYFNNLKAVEMPKEDIELLLKTLENEKVKFEKRLYTYLKRFGLSKVRSWTYIAD